MMRWETGWSGSLVMTAHQSISSHCVFGRLHLPSRARLIPVFVCSSSWCFFPLKGEKEEKKLPTYLCSRDFLLTVSHLLIEGLIVEKTGFYGQLMKCL
jgi:hypothetical protein